MERGTFRKIFLIICKHMDGLNNKRTKSGGVRIHPYISGIRLIAMCFIIASHFCQYYGSEWA